MVESPSFQSSSKTDRELPKLPESPASPSKRIAALSKSELLARTASLAEEERRIGVELLWHLREIERRRLAESMGFSGIFEYCVHVLKLSDGSAYRRIQAMRALKEAPEIAESLRDGRLNMTTAAQLQTFLQRAKKAGLSKEEILLRIANNRGRTGGGASRIPTATASSGVDSTPSGGPTPGATDTDLASASARPKENSGRESAPIFASMENLSRREIEAELTAIAPELPIVERERSLGASEWEIRVTISQDTKTKWRRIQSLAAHRLRFDTSTRRLIEFTANTTLRHLEKTKDHPGPTARPDANAAAAEAFSLSSEPSSGSPANPTRPTSGRAIPIAVRRSVWRRDQGRCQYHDPSSGRRCESRFGLEIDHIRPWSRGGSSTDLENLRLLCAAHHRLITERTFGSPPPPRSSATDMRN